jgi:hypothetical protein
MHEEFAKHAEQHWFVSEFGISATIFDPADQLSSSVALQVPAAAAEQSSARRQQNMRNLLFGESMLERCLRPGRKSFLCQLP